MFATVLLAVTLGVSPTYAVAAAAYNGYTIYFIHQRERKRAQEREVEERRRKQEREAEERRRK